MQKHYEFLSMVEHMRTLQKQYFKFRTDYLLKECKAAEKRVDLAIFDIKNAPCQGSLFDWADDRRPVPPPPSQEAKIVRMFDIITKNT